MNRGASLHTLGIVLLVCVCTAIAGAAAVLVVPQVWAAAATTVAGRETVVVLDTGEQTLDLPVPEGWAMRPEGPAGITLTMPDGEHRVEFALHGQVDAATAVRDAARGRPAAWSEESLRSGPLLRHTHTDAGERVGALIDADVVLVFVATRSTSGGRIAEGVDVDAELGALIAAIGAAR